MVLRVAAVQAAPVLLDRERSLEKAIALIGEAASRGARVIGFGESWLPGYPAWLDLCPGSAFWDHPPAKKVHARLRENSLTIPGPETERLGRAARAHGVVIVLGVHERVVAGPGHGTLYNTQLLFGPDGALLGRHRKLVPTHAERLVWGPGDGAGLEAVPVLGARIGSLICWEHWMPLARQAMHESGEQIHVAVWPTVREMYQIASRHYAFEGRCFVLAVGQIIHASDLPRELEPPEELRGRPESLIVSGGSCIIGPDGALIAGPVFDREEILIADLDLSRIDEESLVLDVTGHYQRPDVFDFAVRPLRTAAAPGSATHGSTPPGSRPPGSTPGRVPQPAGRSSGGLRRRKAVHRARS
ncbi:MAG TPA: carbon-nitrogen hydrolase family protein [Candidatus Cryosericum sp.]|nr:carbon-nitrogen hydrolase family protein [Candidatus Cryosericum sp.]